MESARAAGDVMSEYDLSIIIPSYLEGENLCCILPRIKKTLSGLKIKFEINVIDTLEPMDNSKNVCLENGVNYFNRGKGNCYGDAVRTGIKFARGKYIVFMDGDGSHTPEFIPELVKHRANFDVVIASRYVEGGFTDNNKILIFMSRAVNFFYVLILQLGCKDASNSFKLYQTEILKALDLYSNNFDIIEEILFKLKRNDRHLRIREVPYTFKQRMFGHTKRNLVFFAFSYLFSLIKLRISK